MEWGLSWATLLMGVAIFLARIVDVSMGTIRTIAIVQGRTTAAFFLGFFEVSMWLVVVATVVGKVMDQPILGVFYALGFSTGNVIGIKIERRIAFGYTVLRVISQKKGHHMAEEIRQAGYPVTTFEGEGKSGPVTELYVVCRRKDLRTLLSLVTKIDSQAFYITEQAGGVSKIPRPFMSPRTGWRAIMKKK